MANFAATSDPYKANPAALNQSGINSFSITPGIGFVIIPRQIHNGGTAGTVVGWLVGDDPNSSARTFYMSQGATLSYRFIKIDSTSSAGGLVGIW